MKICGFTYSTDKLSISAGVRVEGMGPHIFYGQHKNEYSLLVAGNNRQGARNLEQLLQVHDIQKSGGEIIQWLQRQSREISSGKSGATPALLQGESLQV